LRLRLLRVRADFPLQIDWSTKKSYHIKTTFVQVEKILFLLSPSIQAGINQYFRTQIRLAVPGHEDNSIFMEIQYESFKFSFLFISPNVTRRHGDLKQH
jgi:hypothetical protein